MPENYYIRSLAILKNRPETCQWIDFPGDDSRNSASSEVCFTGANGTGKSTLLQDLHDHFAADETSPEEARHTASSQKLVITSLTLDGEIVHRISRGSATETALLNTYRDSDLLREHLETWRNGQTPLSEILSALSNCDEDIIEAAAGIENSVLYFSTDGEYRGNTIQPDLTQRLSRHFSDRRDQFLLFLAEPSTQQKKVTDAIAEFRENTPNLLEELATLWDTSLVDSSGIAFHPNTATFSFSGNGEAADFHSFSAPLKRFLTATGSLFSTCRLEATPPSLILIDEPELGLSPGLASHFLEIARTITSDLPTQLIITSKSPEIQAAFSPLNQIELKLDRSGKRIVEMPAIEIEDNSAEPPEEDPLPVKTRGHNKIALSKLKRAIEETEDQDELANLIDEMMSLRKL